jgi:hypothetical protein
MDPTALNIQDLDKATLVRGLWNNAKVGHSIGVPLQPLDMTTVHKLLAKNGRIEYLDGRFIGVDLSGDTVDATRYNEKNGPELLERVVIEVRAATQQ